jgi:putative dimethyl sulfoxide reductase chaperone
MSTTSVTTEPTIDAPTANLCYLLARAFAQPDSFTGEEPGLLREALAAANQDLDPEGPELAQQWEAALDADPNVLLRSYARLFLGPFEILAAPYASFYLDPEQRLMGEVSQAVAQRYAEAGLAPREDQPCDAPDHIVNECEFLYYLAHQSLGSDDPTRAAALQQQFHSFAREHLAQWIPKFSDTILAVDDLHPFYPALARFARRFATQVQPTT